MSWRGGGATRRPSDLLGKRCGGGVAAKRRGGGVAAVWRR
jgi:hypothetical protein